MSLEIRPALVTDLAQLRNLYQAWRLQQPAYPRLDAEEEDRFVAAWEAQFLAHPDRHLALVALLDGQLVGFMDGDIMRRRWGKPRYYLHGSSLWVEPVARGQGVAVQLLYACTAWLAQQGAGIATLEMSEVPATKGAWSTRGWAQREVATSYWADLSSLAPLFCPEGATP